MQATKTIRVGAGQAGIWEQCEQNRRFNKKSVTPIIGTATPDRVQGALMPHLLRTITGRASCFLLATSSTPREPVLRDQMSSGTQIGLQVHHLLRSNLLFKGEKLEFYSACRDLTAHLLRRRVTFGEQLRACYGSRMPMRLLLVISMDQTGSWSTVGQYRQEAAANC